MDQDLVRSSDQNGVDAFNGLTAKQCQVLDLLIEHKTSKEISRMLGISPHTVDQRIMLARAKLGVATRSQVAQAYRRLLAEHELPADRPLYQRPVYGLPDIARAAETAQIEFQDEHDTGSSGTRSEPTETLPPREPKSLPTDFSRDFYHVLPEAFDGRNGTLLRLGAIAILTMFLALVTMGGLAMYSQLSHMLDG